MTTAHFLYIPLMLMTGMFVGFLLGSKATRNAIALEQKRQEARRARKAAANDSEAK